MFKNLILFMMIVVVSQAKTIVVDYVVEFGIVGQVGKVHTQYKEHKKNYIIDTNLSAVGMLAKRATHNLKERHICKGFIDKNGMRIVTSYEMIKSYGKYKSTTLYSVNHKTKKVIKAYKRWEKRGAKGYKKVRDYAYTLGYYARDDMITLFLNLDKHIKDKKRAKHYVFKAVGADRKNGRVDINIPRKNEAKKMQTLLGKTKKDEWVMNLVMHRKLYNSKKGELMVKMGKDSIVQKAVLKDILFFGDVRIIKQ